MTDGYVVDFHIHSKFSRACSRDLVLPNIAAAAALKGIDLVGTGDFTHPEWFRMMGEELRQNSRGFYEVRGVETFHPVEFVPTAEIACIYSKGGKVRRLHLIVVAPTLAVAGEINGRLAKIGNLSADGRPILGLDAKELLKICLDVSPDTMLIPAHAWTPWFSVFGSKSGFDNLAECFGELAPHVTAIETGLSSNPPMNWRLSALDAVTLVSNSDAHSLDNLGREANVLKRGGGMTYGRLRQILRREEAGGFLYTIEFYPEEGKYHLDGHAACGVRLEPAETRRLGGRCPRCQKLVTVGVLSRVTDLADRPADQPAGGRVPFKSIVPLREVLGGVLGVGKAAKRVGAVYRSLVPALGSEFEVLLEAPLDRLAAAAGPAVSQAVEQVRRGDIVVSPGYDGVFGTVRLARPSGPTPSPQPSLFG